MDGGHLASGLGGDTQGTGITMGTPAMCLVLPVLPQALGHLLAALPLQKREQQELCCCAKGRVRKCSGCSASLCCPCGQGQGGRQVTHSPWLIHPRWLAGAAREPGCLQLFQDVCPEPVHHPGLQDESACLLPQKCSSWMQPGRTNPGRCQPPHPDTALICEDRGVPGGVGTQLPPGRVCSSSSACRRGSPAARR